MEVLKITAEGPATSFRYPHFMQGVQPSFDVPPPATIYGHVCSVLGEWIDPVGVQFAIHFTYKKKIADMEHTHVLWPSSGRLPGRKEPKTAEGAVNPFRREILFGPRLVLYINKPEWAEAFRSPRYAVALGRSQDLFMYTGVETVKLERSDHAYLEHTLLPYELNRYIGQGITVLMPRWLDYQHNRTPTFARYLVLMRRRHSRDFLRYEAEAPLEYWVDPTSPEIEGDRLGLFFHGWVDTP